MKVMGILNTTPDSFSDGGLSFTPDDAFARAVEMTSQGVDIIDVGGESTRPGSDPISIKTELDRVIPAIQRIKDLGPEISIDSYKTQVVKKALDNGASIVNDINGLRTPGMADLISDYGATVVIMHMQGSPKDMQKNPKYTDIISELNDFFNQQVEYAENSGINKNNIILDPGIGFGKSLEHNLKILNSIDEFKKLGYPLLIGHSRKSFIEMALGTKINERDPVTLSISTYLYLKNVDYVRVHDVGNTVQAKIILDKLLSL